MKDTRTIANVPVIELLNVFGEPDTLLRESTTATDELMVCENFALDRTSVQQLAVILQRWVDTGVLSSVAASLAPPTPRPTMGEAQVWAVLRADGSLRFDASGRPVVFFHEGEALHAAREKDRIYPSDAPHYSGRLVKLRDDEYIASIAAAEFGVLPPVDPRARRGEQQGIGEGRRHASGLPAPNADAPSNTAPSVAPVALAPSTAQFEQAVDEFRNAAATFDRYPGEDRRCDVVAARNRLRELFHSNRPAERDGDGAVEGLRGRVTNNSSGWVSISLRADWPVGTWVRVTADSDTAPSTQGTGEDGP